MQRWALLLSAYNHDIRFRPTQAHGNANGLSRLPVREDQSCTPDNAMVFNIAQLDALPVCSSELMAATRTDPQLSKVLQYVRKGWPEKISDTLRPFWRRSELTLEGDSVLWGVHVVVPAKLRYRVLEELHRGHPGVVRMKALARSHVWCPELDREIEDRVKACVSCQAVKHAPAKAPLHPWAWPTAPWERIHVDFADLLLEECYL